MHTCTPSGHCGLRQPCFFQFGGSLFILKRRQMQPFNLVISSPCGLIPCQRFCWLNQNQKSCSVHRFSIRVKTSSGLYFWALGIHLHNTGPDRNWETRRAAEKGGGTGACSSWFGVSTLFTNAKGAFSFLFSQVAYFR